MLRVARVTDPTGRYYLSDLSSDLALDHQGIDARRAGPSGGRWAGSAAAALGLEGPVDAGPLAAVLSGRHPAGGHQLRRRETTVRAYDLVFAAPKSASVLFGLGTPEAARAVADAHADAVAAATDYVSRHAAAVRRTDAHGRSTSPVDGLVAASFTHRVSRALDPHLHSHVVVANLARGDDGRWRAIDGRGLYAHARAAGALYDAVLRHGVTARVGLEWSSVHPRGWELAAVDPALAGALSSRRAEILAELDTYARRRPPAPGGAGWQGRWAAPTRRARAVAWAATREPKAGEPSSDELHARWASIARDAVGSVTFGHERRASRALCAEIDEHRFAAAIHETGDRGVARRDAVRAWSSALGTGAPGEAIARCVRALCDWGAPSGVGERLHAPSEVVPAPHALRVLGPRPASPERLAVWLSAASSIARYRERWEVPDRPGLLGGETRAELAAMPALRLADHLSTAREVDEAMIALGRRRERSRRLDRDHGLVRGRD